MTPKTPFKIKFPFTLTILIGLIGLLSIYPSQLALAVEPGGDGGDSGAKAIENRLKLDEKQTSEEVKRLEQLQKEDSKDCEAESGNYDAGSGTGGAGENGQGKPSVDDPVQNPGPNDPQGYGEPTGGEKEVRDALAAKGIVPNKGDCGGKRYQEVKGGCTDVAGLPQHSIDRLGELNQQVEGGIILTGGTEAGHSKSGGSRAHAPGNNVVDLHPSTGLKAYVNQHTVKTWSGGELGTWHELDNGDQFLAEDFGTDNAHYHARLKGKVGTTQTAIRNINKFIGQTTKSLKKFVTQNVLTQYVFAVNNNPGSIVLLGSIEVDLNAVAPEELSQIVNNLSVSDINASFSAMSSGNLQQITTLMTFDSLNNVFSQLTPAALDQIMPALGSGGLEEIVGNLAYESIDNIVGNLSAGPLNSLLGGLSDGAINNLLGSVYNGDILDGVMGKLSGDVLDNIIGQLGDGAINNIFGNLSNGVLNDVLGGLGMDSLNDIFGQLGGSALNQVLGGLTGNLSETIFSVLSDSAIGNILNNGLADVVDKVMGGLSTGLLTDIFNSFSLDGVLAPFKDILEKLPGVTELLTKIPVLGEAVTTLLGGAGAGGIVDTAIGLVGGGLYVPVVEQNGQLMTLAKSTNKTTKEIKDLNVQICTHLKAIKRIQARMELKNTEDANVVRTRATEIEKYRQALYGDNGLIKTGYTTLDSEGNPQKGPLFITNNKQHWQVSEAEGEGIAKDAISKSSNLYKNEFLNYWNSSNPFSLNSDITPDDFKNLGVTSESETSGIVTKSNSPLSSKKIPIVSSLLKPFSKIAFWLTGNKAWAVGEETPTAGADGQEYWASWLKLIEPKNNALGSFAIGLDKMSLEKNLAISSAREEAAQGQGFLPVRKCIEVGGSGNDKTCLAWGTVQPGIIIKEATAAAANSRLTQYENADNISEISQGNEPNVQEIIDNRPVETGGGAVGPGMTSPGSISSTGLVSDAGTNQVKPGNTPGDTNDNEAESALDGSGISDLLSSLFNSSDNPNLESGDLQDLINTFKQAFAFVWNSLKPKVIVGSKAKDDGSDLIYWYSPNATNCATTNAWVDAKSASGVIKTSGQNLGGDNGSLRVTATTTSQYKLKCTNNRGDSKEKVIEINK